MMRVARRVLYISMLGVLLASCSTHEKHWSYAGEENPEKWGDLDPSYFACKEGRNQSPIDINSVTKIAKQSPIKYQYNTAISGDLVNNGHTVQFSPKFDNNYVVVDNTKFTLKQFHIHTPSEYTINGKTYPLEAHFVHTNANGEILVVGVMYEEGRENKTWNSLLPHLNKTVNAPQTVSNNIDIFGLLPKNRAYYRFSGSLTTPPCSEGVIWIMMKKPEMVSPIQLKKIKEVIDYNNNRPIQKINGRVIVG